jgi:hypothetical protein
LENQEEAYENVSLDREHQQTHGTKISRKNGSRVIIMATVMVWLLKCNIGLEAALKFYA